jgi:hypothetical protein
VGDGWIKNDLARLARKAERVGEDGKSEVILPRSLRKMDREILDIVCGVYREKSPELFSRYCGD